MEQGKDEGRRKLRKFCEEFAEAIRLWRGDIEMTISGKRLVRIDVSSGVKACCVEVKGDVWVTYGTANPVDISKGLDLLTEPIKRMIVTAVGDHGAVEVRVSGGDVTSLVINTSLMPSGGRGGHGRGGRGRAR